MGPADPMHGRGVLAIAAMIGASLCYLVGDTLVKLASASVPIPQIITIRGFLTFLFVAAAAAAARQLGSWHMILDRRVLARGAFDAVATLLFTTALAHMRIADATALINGVPIAAAALAIVFLKERVGARRWTAIAGGFIGVLLVLQPEGGSFNAYGLLAAGAMIMVACRDVITRTIPPRIPALMITLWSVIAVATSGAAASLGTGGWIGLSGPELALIGGAALALFGAYHLSVLARRHGEVSLVGPFRYTIIVWGLIVGYVVWRDVPGPASLAGMAIIVAAGLVVLRGERRRARTTGAAQE